MKRIKVLPAAAPVHHPTDCFVQVVPAGSMQKEQLAKLSAHLSSSITLSPRQRSMLKLTGATRDLALVGVAVVQDMHCT